MDSKPCVLVVEDNVSWQELYEEGLEDIDCTVSIVDNKKSTLAALERRHFHVVIIDLELKGEKRNRDGLAVIKRVWSLDEGTRYLVGSAKGDISMFDEFRKMGIFSFTQIPLEAQKQMRKIGEFDGVKAKEKILEDVNKALNIVWPEHIKKQWEQPFGVLRGFSAKEIQRHLKAGKTEELRPFLSSLVRPIYPWLNSKNDSIPIKNKNGNIIAFESVCWSRALGYAVAIRFGKRDDFQASIGMQPVANGYGDVESEELYRKPDEESNHIPFKGVVYKLRNIDFDAYFDPPPIKRTGEQTAPQIRD